MRRGFTLIEASLAMIVGALLLMTCLSMMTAMERTEASAARRHTQAASLARLHLVVSRSVQHLRVSSTTPPASREERAIGAPVDPRREQERAPEPPAEPPRLILAFDTSAGLLELNRQALYSGRPPLLTHAGEGPPRLEVVNGRSPVPEGFILGLDRSIAQVAAALGSPRREAGSGPMRSALELRPDWATRRVGKAAQAEWRRRLDDGWTLWWRPIDAEATGAVSGSRDLDPTEDPAAVPLASNIRTIRWRAFRTDPGSGERGFLDEYEATWMTDLPAYIELQIETTAGLSASWLFEVGWDFGPEATRSTDTADQDQPGAGGPSGAAGGGDRTPQGRAPTRRPGDPAGGAR